jgi:hypothetical protein
LGGPRVVYALYLGANITLGGRLTLSTCGTTTNNTALYIGTGCPTWYGSFNCRAGNDDAGDVAGQSCPSNPRASTIVLSVASRVYFVQVGGLGGFAERLVSGLTWSYAPPPSATPTRTRSRTRTRSIVPRTASITSSRTKSASRTRKAK